MTVYRDAPLPDLPVEDDGFHHCSNCGNEWWLTQVCLGATGEVGAVSMMAVCGACMFPLWYEAGTDWPS